MSMANTRGRALIELNSKNMASTKETKEHTIDINKLNLGQLTQLKQQFDQVVYN